MYQLSLSIMGPGQNGSRSQCRGMRHTFVSQYAHARAHNTGCGTIGRRLKLYSDFHDINGIGACGGSADGDSAGSQLEYHLCGGRRQERHAERLFMSNFHPTTSKPKQNNRTLAGCSVATRQLPSKPSEAPRNGLHCNALSVAQSRWTTASPACYAAVCTLLGVDTWPTQPAGCRRCSRGCKTRAVDHSTCGHSVWILPSA